MKMLASFINCYVIANSGKIWNKFVVRSRIKVVRERIKKIINACPTYNNEQTILFVTYIPNFAAFYIQFRYNNAV